MNVHFRKLNPAIVLEIGSGSGIIITSIARVCKKSYCLAIDINPKACLATGNTAQLNDTSVNIFHVNFLVITLHYIFLEINIF